MIKISASVIPLMLGLALLSACEGGLMTRGDVKEAENKRQIQDSVSTLQKTTADTNSRFSEIESDLRSLNGRVEVVENKFNQSAAERERTKGASEQSLADQVRKTQILQDEIVKLQEQIGTLTAEMNAIKSAGADSPAGAVKKDQFEMADELFEKKDWKRAIISFQKYRDQNPKGKKFAEATYKIGVCFQELGLKDEAKTFYDEVVVKHPQSAEAKKARTRIKSLKK